MKIFSYLVVIILFPGRKSQNWNYDRFDNWPLECRLGKSQSPIPINKDDVVKQTMPLFNFINYDIPLSATLDNTGATVEIKFEENINHPSIQGSILQSDYTLDNIHFHWPSEHTIDGKRYPLEAHFVHFKTKAKNLQTALNFKDGVVVFAVMYEISKLPNDFLYDITEYVEDIAHKVRQPLKLDAPFFPSSLLPSKTDSYFTYQGSLTTPNCDESVLWFVFPHPSSISQAQLDDLTNIYTRNGEPLLFNSRPLQKINGREVLFTNGVHRHRS